MLILVLTLLLATSLLIGGCGRCSRCYEWKGNIMAIKGSDTSIIYGPQATFTRYIDSLKSQGYMVDTIVLWFEDIGGGKICGKKNVQNFESVGDSCAVVGL